MNILFVTHRFVDPHIGGIERITYNLTNSLKQNGYGCYSSYFEEYKSDMADENVFDGTKKISEEHVFESIRSWIIEKNIQIVIAQGSDESVNSIMLELSKAVKSVTKCKLIFVFHTMPGFEQVDLNKNVLLYRIFHGQDFIYNAKYLLFCFFKPIIKKIIGSKWTMKYKLPYQYSDKVVVLTEKYREIYAEWANEKNLDKICSIPNMYYSQANADKKECGKEKIMLWVGRFDDRSKRLSLALEAWRLLGDEVNEWRFCIVGYGMDENYYRSYVEKYNLKNVSFEGFQDPSKYYEKASIYLMTSAFEGFPMVLLEAMEKGTVPVVFDSFASLHDVIDDGVNGFVVENNQLNTYCSRIKQLMMNEELRARMSCSAISSLNKFSSDRVIKKWIDLFDNLLKE